MRGIRHDQGCDGSQSLHHLSRIVESPHVRIASREKPICGRPSRMLLQRSQQQRRGVVKSLSEEMSDADSHKGPGFASVRAEPQGSVEMADREIRLPCPEPKPAAYHPAVREAGVERQGPVDQF